MFKTLIVMWILLVLGNYDSVIDNLNTVLYILKIGYFLNRLMKR